MISHKRSPRGSGGEGLLSVIGWKVRAGIYGMAVDSERKGEKLEASGGESMATALRQKETLPHMHLFSCSILGKGYQMRSGCLQEKKRT